MSTEQSEIKQGLPHLPLFNWTIPLGSGHCMIYYSLYNFINKYVSMILRQYPVIYKNSVHYT